MNFLMEEFLRHHFVLRTIDYDVPEEGVSFWYISKGLKFSRITKYCLFQCHIFITPKIERVMVDLLLSIPYEDEDEDEAISKAEEEEREIFAPLIKAGKIKVKPGNIFAQTTFKLSNFNAVNFVDWIGEQVNPVKCAISEFHYADIERDSIV